MLELILYFGPVILVVLLVLLIITQGYVKAPPDHAYIISGLRKEPRVLVGRAGLKLPFFEQLDKLYLGQITVDIKTDEYIPTNDFINVMVDAVAKVRVADDPAMLKLAMRNFLNKNSAKIAADLQDSLQGNMREIIGTLTLRAINTDRDSFSDQVMAKASKDMEKLGIEILSCNIQNVTDEHGLIQDLGMDNTSKIRKDASIAKAEAERDIAIAQAAADKASNEARVLAETEIAQKNNELAIKKAEADAAYEIQKQEQQKTIQAATVNAQIAKAEREAELRRQEVAVQQQALEAEINKKADADRYAIEQAAAADLTRRQREAEAKKYEQEKEAEARKAQAEAQKYAMLQEAEGIRARGEAEAAAIQAKALAEAEGMEKKAQAYQKYNHAAMAEMMMKVLPEIAGKIAEPLSQIDKITIIGGGNGSDDGVGNVAGNVPVVMAKLFESMKEATGVDLAEIMKADTYDAKVTRNINLNGAEDALKQVIAADTAPADKPVAENGATADTSSATVNS